MKLFLRKLGKKGKSGDSQTSTPRSSSSKNSIKMKQPVVWDRQPRTSTPINLWGAQTEYDYHLDINSLAAEHNNNNNNNIQRVELCPSCNMPFDKSRKRRLIDSCGHERCYTCIFRNDTCPLCVETGSSPAKSGKVSRMSTPVFDNSSTLQRHGQPRVYGTPLTNRRGLSGSKASRAMMGKSLRSSSSTGLMSPSSHSQESGFMSCDSLANTSAGENNPNLANTLSVDSGLVNDAKFESQRQTSFRSLSRFPTEPSRRCVAADSTEGVAYSQITPWSLRPLYFEVPQQQPGMRLTGRQWVFREILEHLMSELPTNRGVLVTGAPGSGKTAIVLSMVEHSCFGSSSFSYQQEVVKSRSSTSLRSTAASSQTTDDSLLALSKNVVAYHFCQADNAPTCSVPEFVHSLAAQLSQSPRLRPYMDLVMEDPDLQRMLSLSQCTVNPSESLVRGVLQPLASLRRLGRVPDQPCIVLVDALCEAEVHRPDTGDTLASFVAKHLMKFPSWLKIVCTVRSSMLDITKLLPFHKVNLDKTDVDERLNKDLKDYISSRISSSSSIQANIKLPIHKVLEGDPSANLISYLVKVSRGCFLYAKLTLDLIERGNLVIKSATFKVLPLSLSEIFLLAFNLRFSSTRSYERVTDILSICLAALQPMTPAEIFGHLSAMSVVAEVGWPQFLERFNALTEFLVQRADGSVMFFHPTFRDWLVKRRDQDSAKFLIDPRNGHAALAFSLARGGGMLRPEKVLELAHHLLKANPHKNSVAHESAGLLPARDFHAYLVSLASDDISGALGCARNIFNPIVKVSRLLLLSGASPDYITDQLNHSPLLGVHSFIGNRDMVSLLLEFGADVNKTNSRGVTPLSMAAAAGNFEIMQMLLQAKATVNRVDKEDKSALLAAVENGHFSVVEYLVTTDWITTPVHDLGLEEAVQQGLVAAASQGHLQLVDFFLDMSEVQVDSPDTLIGDTALCAAAKSGNMAASQQLIRRGASLESTNLKDYRPIQVAAKEGHWEIVDLMLKEGASTSSRDSQGRSALILAASEGHAGVIELLHRAGSRLDEKDAEGLTALSWASVKGRLETVASLLKLGAFIDEPDQAGRTPLDLAAYRGDEELVELLLNHGADMEHLDGHGMRPLDRAIGCKNASVVNCFLRKGAKLGPATWAMANGKPEILLILLNKLLEDGNTLFKKNCLTEAGHRYRYALRRLPSREDGELAHTFLQLRTHLLMNLCRCLRRQGNSSEAIAVADQVIQLAPHHPEARLAKAKALKEAGQEGQAIKELAELLNFSPGNREATRLLVRLREGQKLSANLAKFPIGFGSSETISYIDDTSNVSSVNS